jgi:predicted enzyme related to lactoylglutathione lyase
MAKLISNSWVAAESKNIPRAVRFYAKLGLKPSVRMPSYAEFVVPGGTVIGLYSMGNKKVKKPAGGWQIMIRVKDMKKSTADLKRKGIRATPIPSPGGGAMLSWFLDPDGNRLVLIHFG